MKPNTNLLTIATVMAFTLALSHCKTLQKSKEPTVPTTVLQEATPQPSAPDQEEFLNPKQGFVNSSTFQVVVSSLKSDKKEAESEALKVAQKKAFQMLQTEAKSGLSSEGKAELLEISQSGKMAKSSASIQGKYYFVYQIQRSGLESYVKTRLK